MTEIHLRDRGRMIEIGEDEGRDDAMEPQAQDTEDFQNHEKLERGRKDPPPEPLKDSPNNR